MSEDDSTPELYEVIYSDQIRAMIVQLGRDAQKRGDGTRFANALREFHRRLCIYPQFGDPLRNLRLETGHMRLGVVPPLVMRYAVLEEHRRVLVGVPVLMSRPA